MDVPPSPTPRPLRTSGSDRAGNLPAAHGGVDLDPQTVRLQVHAIPRRDTETDTRPPRVRCGTAAHRGHQARDTHPGGVP